MNIHTADDIDVMRQMSALGYADDAMMLTIRQRRYYAFMRGVMRVDTASCARAKMRVMRYAARLREVSERLRAADVCCCARCQQRVFASAEPPRCR